MNVLILGGTGQLGIELLRARWPAGVRQVRALTRADMDLTRPDLLPGVLDRAKEFDLLVNAAAYTAVDRAESEPDMAFAVNREAPAALAEVCAARGVPLIHVSTDYVFDGEQSEPYTEDDPVRPINIYGASKAAGEEAIRGVHGQHVILRTSWLYSAHGRNFVTSMLRLAKQRDEVRIVDDQHGCPTSAADLAGAIVDLAGQIQAGKDMAWGTYHYAGDGATTWFGLAGFVFDVSKECGGRRPRLIAIPTSEYPTPARRPRDSRLDCTRIAGAFGIEPCPWRQSCRAVVEECSGRNAEIAS